MKVWGKCVAAAGLAIGLSLSAIEPAALAAGTAAKAPPKPVTVLLDDVPMTFDGTAAEITSNLTFVPFRAIAEALGIDVGWTAATKTITATGTVEGQAVKVVLQVDKLAATVNGKSVKLAAAPYMKDGRTLIPLNFFSTQFGAEVGWDGATRTVSIVSPVRPLHLRGFYAIHAFQERSYIAAMDSVAFGWIRVGADGEMTTAGKDFYWPAASGDVTPEAIVQDADAQGTKPYLMAYAVDGNGELTKMLSDPELSTRSIDSIASLAKDKGFGGVLLDYEGLGLKLDPVAQQKLLNDYVKRLADRLKPDGIQLSLAVPPPNSAYKGYDYVSLAGWADDLVVMAYEYLPPDAPDHTPQPNDKVDAAIGSLIRAGVPKEKLLLGIDLWSETPASIDDKLGLAKRYGLKGAAFWRIGLFFHYGQDMADAINRAATKAGK